MQDLIVMGGIVLIAGFLQGLTGFGFGLIAMPLLGFFLPLKTIIPLLIMLALCISVYLSFQLRAAIRYSTIFALFLATLPCIPLGVYALKHFSAQSLSLVLGMVMVAFTSYQLLAKPNKRALGLGSTIIAGGLSGVLAGSIGLGGPPIIIYSAMQPWAKDESKATLASFFAISGAVVCANHAVSGLITSNVLKLFIFLLPTLIVGIWIGVISYKHLSDQIYRKLAFITVFLLGLMMIYRNI